MLFLLGGCVALAIPPALIAMGYAADGASYTMSGKTVNDHALSTVVDEECALIRLVELENPCREYEEDDGAEDGVADEQVAEADVAPEAIPVETADRDSVVERFELDPVAADTAVARVASVEQEMPVAEASPEDSHTVVLGSFSREANARNLARAHADADAEVVVAQVGGKTYYRVQTAARSKTEAQSLRDRLADSGVGDAWLLETGPAVEQVGELTRASGG